MFTRFERRRDARQGFTLIELLVVIAIIGILSSVVLASLNSARKKGRDARRVADVKQLQLALELFYDANGAYPATTSVALLVDNGYIATIPTDPTNSKRYNYVPYAASGSTAICSGYHIGVSLETADHSGLKSDSDITTFPSGLALCTAAGVSTGLGASDINGLDSAQCATGDAGTSCYDVRS